MLDVLRTDVRDGAVGVGLELLALLVLQPHSSSFVQVVYGACCVLWMQMRGCEWVAGWVAACSLDSKVPGMVTASVAVWGGVRARASASDNLVHRHRLQPAGSVARAAVGASGAVESIWLLVEYFSDSSQKGREQPPDCACGFFWCGMTAVRAVGLGVDSSSLVDQA